MKPTHAYTEKFTRICGQTLFYHLPSDQQAFLLDKACRYHFTLQELKQLCDIALDFNMWGESSIIECWPDDQSLPDREEREKKKRLIAQLQTRWNQLKTQAIHYPVRRAKIQHTPLKLEIEQHKKERLGLGYCPVASEKTRCCNLLTLDAIESCGFDCNYCSIQSFYTENRITFDSGFKDKLRRLQLDPEQIYHIGTGQSSDSLLWGNKHGVLEALLDFARTHTNVILELKTKSKNIAYLMEQDVPANVICTWSLNTPTLIAHEEHRTASLSERLDSPRLLADKGVLVGFHFHPMIHYDNWRQDYSLIFEQLQNRFQPSEVVMVSLGTLTFTKSVIKQIRKRCAKSKILQAPLEKCDGKLSYPKATKLEMFSHAYNGLKAWHNEVFFYLCMENHALWQPVFGHEYPTNDDFESAMKANYMNKIRQAAIRLGKGRSI